MEGWTKRLLITGIAVFLCVLVIVSFAGGMGGSGNMAGDLRNSRSGSAASQEDGTAQKEAGQKAETQGLETRKTGAQKSETQKTGETEWELVQRVKPKEKLEVSFEHTNLRIRENTSADAAEMEVYVTKGSNRKVEVREDETGEVKLETDYLPNANETGEVLLLLPRGIHFRELDFSAEGGQIISEAVLNADKIEADTDGGTLHLLLKGKEADYLWEVENEQGTVRIGTEKNAVTKHGSQSESGHRLFVDCDKGTVEIDFSEK